MSDRFQQIRAAFDRAAPTYEDSAQLQREVTARLMERLHYIKFNPKTVLDLGAGTGGGCRALRKRFPGASTVALDCAPAMLRQLKKRAGLWRRPRPVCADARRLPLADNSVELIFSSLTLQWCEPLTEVFAEAFRVLRPGGLLIFATLGPDTLYELRDSWTAVDGARHTNTFEDMHNIGDALLAQGFADPVMDMEKITMAYQSVTGLLRDLKRIGANTLLDRDDSLKALTGKGRLRAMARAYDRYRRGDGSYPATYEVVYGLAWGRNPHEQAVSFVSPDRIGRGAPGG